VALAAGGLVPPLLEALTAGVASPAPPAAASAASAAAAAEAAAGAPILRAKLLEVVRIMYQHYPRPKEFIMKYRIQVCWGCCVCCVCCVCVCGDACGGLQLRCAL
jgi:hypothetical protein